MNITRAEATYTGGGIYVYTGQLSNGKYFMTADEWEDYVLLLDVDPDKYWDDNGFVEWQEEHKAGEIYDQEARDFWVKMLDLCKPMMDFYDHKRRLNKLLR